MKSGWLRVLRIGSVERDVAEELSYHRQRTIERLMAEGATRSEAEAEATRRFGDEGRWRRELERLDRGLAARRRWVGWASTMRDVVTGAVRGVARDPGFTAAIAVLFALGVGANAVMFGITDRVLLSAPAHVTNPERVKRLMVERYQSRLGRAEPTAAWTYGDYRALTAAGTLSGVAAYAKRDVVVGHGEAAEEVDAVLATAGLFPVLGVRPQLGRFYTRAEDERGGQRVVVLGHGYWTRRYGGAPDVLGRTIELPEGRYEIIGVAPEGFSGAELSGADLWLPLRVAAFPGFDGWMENPHWYWFRVVGRVAEGVTVGRVEAETTRQLRLARSEMIEAGDYDADARVLATPLIAARGPLASNESTVVKWLAGVSLLVLLIAAFNVANLLLARTSDRRREIAVRMALGISRGRLAAEMLAEAVLLALIGAAAALAVAIYAGGALQRVLLPNVAWGDPLTPRLIGFTIAVGLITGVAAVALPVIQSFRGRVGEALRSGRRTAGQGGGVRTALTAAQAALSVLLLAGAGLFVQSLNRVQGLDLGLAVDGLIVAEPTGLSELSIQERNRVMDEAVSRIRRIPAVVSATPSGMSRVLGGVIFYDLRVPGRDSLPELTGRTPAATLVSPEHRSTLGLTLAGGRWIRDDDSEGSTPVVVVNQAFADLLFDGAAIGECFHMRDGPCLVVVGVVENAIRSSPLEDPKPQYYIPRSQHKQYLAQVAYIRVRQNADVGSAIQSVFLAASPAVRYVKVDHVAERLAPYIRPWRLGATLFSAFGMLALIVAGIGLYSLLAYDVSRRTRELGVRAALGATRHRIVRGVLGHSLRVVGLGLAAGLLGAWLLAPRLEDLLFETSPRDLLTFTGVVAALLAVSLVAAGLPARRASRVDPSEALRAD